MALYFKDIEITNIDNLVPQTGIDITDLWFGSTNVYTVWQTYEGTLPATLNANGDDMRQYQIYGNTGGVGDRTKNLFGVDLEMGAFVYSTGAKLESSTRVRSKNAFFLPAGAYTLSCKEERTCGIYVYDTDMNFKASESIRTWSAMPFTLTISGDRYINVQFAGPGAGNLTAIDNISNIMLAEGSTAPASYEPYGYKVDMGVKSGNLFDKDTSTIYNAFINTSNVWNTTPLAKSIKIIVKPNTTYTISAFKILSIFRIGESSNENITPSSTSELTNVIRLTDTASSAFTTSDNAKVIIFQGENDNYQDWINNLVIQEGTIAPANYQPYSNTVTPIYIGGDPLEKDEYIDYQAGKVYRRTAQVMPSAPAETKTSNGITVTCDGEGRYSISGTAANYVSIRFDFPEFTTPTSVGQGGQGTFSIFNDFANSNVTLYFMQGSVSVDDWRLTPANRVNTIYSVVGNKTVNGIIIAISAGATINGVLSPMFTDNGILPETYIPYLQPTDPPVPLPALPTCDGTMIVDYAGQSVSVPEKVVLEYRKKNF